MHAGESSSVVAYVALGSNLGDRAAQLRFARAALAEVPGIEVSAESRIYQTEPIGPVPQSPYLNSVLRVRTRLAPRALLGELLEIERRAGRERGPQRWAPRLLDLDLLVYGSCCIDEPGLVVPHPQLHERAFVLEPLCELAAGERHPLLGRSFEALASAVRNPAAVRLWHEAGAQ